ACERGDPRPRRRPRERRCRPQGRRQGRRRRRQLPARRPDGPSAGRLLKSVVAAHPGDTTVEQKPAPAAENTAPPQGGDDGGWVGIFVRRPILALVLNLLIIIAGFAAYQGIEVRELPDVDRPVVTVRATYTGATPESIDSQITAVIESAVSRVQGVTSI